MPNPLKNFVLSIEKLLYFLLRKAIKFLTGSPGRSKKLFLGELQTNLSYEIYEKVSPSYTVNSIHQRDNLDELHSYQARYFVNLKNIIVDLKNGLVFDSSKNLIEDSTCWPRDSILLNSPTKPIFRIKKESSEKTFSSLVLSSNGYYHWLIEDLPIFLQARSKAPDSIFYVGTNPPKYVEDVIRLMKLQVRVTDRFVRLNNLSTITRGPDAGWPHKHDLQTLRDTFLGPVKMAANKVYISRVKSSRSPEFEPELQAILKLKGWNIVYMEELPLEEQIALVQEAKILCGVHGAGLSSIVWMNPGTKVIELIPRRYVPCFARLSSAIGVNHSSIFFEENNITKSAMEISEKIQKLTETF